MFSVKHARFHWSTLYQWTHLKSSQGCLNSRYANVSCTMLRYRNNAFCVSVCVGRLCVTKHHSPKLEPDPSRSQLNPTGKKIKIKTCWLRSIMQGFYQKQVQSDVTLLKGCEFKKKSDMMGQVERLNETLSYVNILQQQKFNISVNSYFS